MGEPPAPTGPKSGPGVGYVTLCHNLRVTKEATAMGLLEGKVALITGGSRGQGRAHAVRSAQEGADVILFDAPTGVDTVTYNLGTEADLADTVKLVEALDRRALTVTGDVRSVRP